MGHSPNKLRFQFKNEYVYIHNSEAPKGSNLKRDKGKMLKMFRGTKYVSPALGHRKKNWGGEDII